MIDATSIALALIALIAFYLKGVMGTGNSTVIIACASFFIDPKIAVVLTSLLNVFGGLAMIRVDPVPVQLKYWVPIGVMMALGSVAGAVALKNISPDLFKLVLGFAFLLSSGWFLFRPLPVRTFPRKHRRRQIWVSGFSVGFAVVL